jgi:flagellar hook-length control protein FliK
MALPLMSVLNLASGAVNALQKLTGQGSAKGGSFDAELATALNGANGSGNPLAKLLAKNGKIDDEGLKSLLGTPAGFLLFQFMTSMKEMGLSTSDIKGIMAGNGAQMSDDALSALLKKSGIGAGEIESILSSTELKGQLKTALGQAFTSMIEAQATKVGADPAVLSELASSDNATIEEVLAAFKAVPVTDTPAETGQAAQTAQAALAAQAGTATAAPAVVPTDAGAAADPFLKLTVGLIQSNVSHATNEIRSMVSQIVGKIAKTDVKAPVAPESTDASPEVAVDVAKMTETAQSTLGVTRDELKALFFETDPMAREEMVSQVTAKISSFLKSNEGKTLSPEVLHTLSYLKTAMSKTEFAGIDQAVSLWNAGQTVPELNLPMDKGLYTSLAKNLGATGAQNQFDAQMKQVVDQIRQAIPAGSGSQVTISLHPPMLGKVDVSMTLADGQLQANFKTDQLVTRDMLVQNMSILKEALADQGIKAAQFSVSMNFDSRQQQGNANAAMWAGAEKGGHGFGQQGRGQEESGQRAFRGEDTSVYAQANYSGLLDRGLDFFA